MSPQNPKVQKQVKPKTHRKKSIKEIRADIQKKANVTPDRVVMRSETQAVENVDEKDRTGRINITLEMVAADIKALRGQDSARKVAIGLNSEKMREHVGRLCDEASRRRKECSIFQTLASKPEAKDSIPARPLTGVVNVTHVPVEKEQAHVPVLPTLQKLKNSVQVKGLTAGQANVNTRNTVGQVESPVSDYAKSLQMVLSEVADELQLKARHSGVSGVNVQHSVPVTSKIQVDKPKLVRSKSVAKRNSSLASTAPSKTGTSIQLKAAGGGGVVAQMPRSKKALYKTSIDLQGFSNDNISLDLDGHRVIVVAYRPKDKTNHARKITEIIEIPENVVLDNLKVARRPDGALVIEEVIPESKN